MELKDWMGRSITYLREDADAVGDDAGLKDETDVEEVIEEPVETPEADADDQDAFDKEFMDDDIDKDPVDVTSESVDWNNIFR